MSLVGGLGLEQNRSCTRGVVPAEHQNPLLVLDGHLGNQAFRQAAYLRPGVGHGVIGQGRRIGSESITRREEHQMGRAEADG